MTLERLDHKKWFLQEKRPYHYASTLVVIYEATIFYLLYIINLNLVQKKQQKWWSPRGSSGDRAYRVGVVFLMQNDHTALRWIKSTKIVILCMC